jgi:hypothetical protein
MCGYLIVVKIITKTRLSYKSYTNGQRMNMYMLIVHIIHGPFGDIMLTHDLQLNIGYNFIYVTKAILVINVACKYFILTNRSLQIDIFLRDHSWRKD